MKAPVLAEQFWPMLPAFKNWLRERGATLLLLAPDQPLEILRFIAHDNIHTIGRNKHGKLNYTNAPAKAALTAFVNNAPWSAVVTR